MPLNTQPLSPTRRAFLLATLLILFAASLGFAQILVRRHPAPPPKPTPRGLAITWNLPNDFTILPHDPEDADLINLRATATLAGHPRELIGIITDFNQLPSDDARLQTAHDLFAEIFNADPASNHPASIANRVGVEVQAQDNTHFAILRLITVQGKAIAICYSGERPITDADTSAFNQVARRVEVRADYHPLESEAPVKFAQPRSLFPRVSPVLAALALACAAVPTHADPDPAPTPANPQADAAESASEYLGNIYKDDKAGIRLARPRGCSLTNRAGDEIVSFKIDDKMWVGDLLIANLKANTTVDEYLHLSVSQLSKDFKGVQVLETRELTFQKHKAGRLTTTMEADITPKGALRKEIITLFRQQLMIQMTDSQFLILQFYTPLKDQKIAEATFTAMLANFELIDKAQADKVRFEAIKLGKEWLAKQSAEDFKAKLINQPQWYRMKTAGKDVGFMQFQEAVIAKDNPLKIGDKRGHAGILLQVNFQDWPNETSAVLGQNWAFWAFSHDPDTKAPVPAYSSWNNLTKTLVKRKDLPNGQYLFWIMESGLLFDENNSTLDPATLDDLKKERELLLKQNLGGAEIPPPIEGPQTQSHIIVTTSGDRNQAFQNGGQGVNVLIPQKIRPAVLPKIMEYVWPRLVDLTKPSLMVFAVYNTAEHKMDLRSLSVIGPDRITLDGKLTDAVKCRDEIGSTGTTPWVDSNGHILKMLTSDQSLIEPTTEEKMTKLWRPAIDKLNRDLHSVPQSADNVLSRPPNLP